MNQAKSTALGVLAHLRRFILDLQGCAGFEFWDNTPTAQIDYRFMRKGDGATRTGSFDPADRILIDASTPREYELALCDLLEIPKHCDWMRGADYVFREPWQFIADLEQLAGADA